jgi:Short C-terminal domain
MFSRKRTFDDRSRLSRDANKALDEVLEADEHVRVIVPGTYGSALIASDTRGFVWKRNHLSVYPFENLTTVAFGAGLVLKWAQFRGPSIGTAGPSVANVTNLLDTVQIDGRIDKKALTELERLVEAGARSIPGFAPGTVLAGSHLQRESNMPGGELPLMEAEGSGGHLWLFEDRIRINHHGFRGALSAGVLKGDKEIGLAQVAAVQWRNAGPMFLGHIQFSFMGGSSDARIASRDENAVQFSKGQEPPFRAIKEEIDRRIRARSQGAPTSAPSASIPEQIRQLAELRDGGILTPAEFEAKKVDLLARM